MHIRPETPQDYAAIAAVHVRAFQNRSTEALIVALHRQRAAFDPDLSLVAEEDGQVIGQALFSPQIIRLWGENVRAVNLAPIGVDLSYQGKGVGGQLVEEGHTIARRKGYALSFLLGHPSYYPRFGYHTGAYGGASLRMPTADLQGEQLSSRGPTEADLALLHDLWLHEEGNVDLAIDPGPDLLDWLSPNPAIQVAVWTRDQQIVGYTRVHANYPARPRIFLARNLGAARAIAAQLAQQAGMPDQLVLPLHPSSASAPAFGEATAEAWLPAMICPLAPSPFEQYYNEVQEGTRAPGRPIWPVAFDLE